MLLPDPMKPCLDFSCKKTASGNFSNFSVSGCVRVWLPSAEETERRATECLTSWFRTHGGEVEKLQIMLKMVSFINKYKY